MTGRVAEEHRLPRATIGLRFDGRGTPPALPVIPAIGREVPLEPLAAEPRVAKDRGHVGVARENPESLRRAMNRVLRAEARVACVRTRERATEQAVAYRCQSRRDRVRSLSVTTRRSPGPIELVVCQAYSPRATEVPASETDIARSRKTREFAVFRVAIERGHPSRGLAARSLLGLPLGSRWGWPGRRERQSISRIVRWLTWMRAASLSCPTLLFRTWESGHVIRTVSAVAEVAADALTVPETVPATLPEMGKTVPRGAARE